jgi:hypothetical protein
MIIIVCFYACNTLKSYGQTNTKRLQRFGVELSRGRFPLELLSTNDTVIRKPIDYGYTTYSWQVAGSCFADVALTPYVDLIVNCMFHVNMLNSNYYFLTTRLGDVDTQLQGSGQIACSLASSVGISKYLPLSKRIAIKLCVSLLLLPAFVGANSKDTVDYMQVFDTETMASVAAKIPVMPGIHTFFGIYFFGKSGRAISVSANYKRQFSAQPFFYTGERQPFSHYPWLVHGSPQNVFSVGLGLVI